MTPFSSRPMPGQTHRLACVASSTLSPVVGSIRSPLPNASSPAVSAYLYSSTRFVVLPVWRGFPTTPTAMQNSELVHETSGPAPPTLGASVLDWAPALGLVINCQAVPFHDSVSVRDGVPLEPY